MIDKKSWSEFRVECCGLSTPYFTLSAGQLYWIFDNGEVAGCSPARVKFGGFSEEVNTKGYIALSEYLKKN